ncbi:DUF4148 domain-containing protein [Burkholderia sp. 4701]|nr:DUF4148 domain-containing protein [Burkholderia sp. 4701]MXN83075.1 DUF4148 domain-containing protein [Burkholderia sp. 4812]
MKSLVPTLALSAALAALPAVGFAQSSGAAWPASAAPQSGSAARAETDAQLVQLTRVGYRATTEGNQNYPLARVHAPVPDRSREEKAAMQAQAASDAHGGHPVKAFFVKTAYYLKGENTF